MWPTALNAWPPWVVMWSMAAAIFAACKWLTWRDHVNPRLAPRASKWRQAAYLLAWPGLDAGAFLDPTPLPRGRRPGAGEWAFALAKLALGAALTWGVARLVPTHLPVLRAWVGMAGVVFLLHFGSFHLLSCAWRATGVDARPLMNWPVLSASVGEFWGRRWNTAFRDLTHRFLFRPLSSRLGARAGLAAGFLFSGVVHDLVISVPAGGGYGWPTLYFVVQGLGLLAEKSKFGKRIGLGEGRRGRLFAALVVIGPAYGLFHPPFLLNVVLPFLDAIGA
jgi:alginate O-acetyltransferase complex protein AlgI